MRKMIHALGGGYMSYEEEDTCHMRKMIHALGGGYMSYEEEDTCHEEDDTCIRRRIHVI
jgi:hypothetical protein